MRPRTTLPHTTLEVSRIAVGGNIFGHFADDQLTRRILEAAADAGLNFIDTADTYSDGRSEEFIGKHTAAIPVSWVVATKIGVPSHGSPRGLGSRTVIRSRCEASLRRLRRETIDLLQMHHLDDDTPLDETVAALHELQAEGLIRAFGVSNFNRRDVEKLAQVQRSLPDTACATIQIPFNILWREWYDSIRELCGEHMIGIVPYNALARGVLSGKYSAATEPPRDSRAHSSAAVRAGLNPRVLDRLAAARDLCADHGLALAQAAVQWVLRQPGITAVPIGFRSPEQLVGMSATSGPHLDDAFFAKLSATLLDGLLPAETKALVYCPERML